MTEFHDFWSAIGPIAAAVWLGTFALLGFFTTATGIVDGYLKKRSHRFGMYFGAAITNATLSSTLLAALYQSGGERLGVFVKTGAVVGEILVWAFVVSVGVTHVVAGPTPLNKVRRGVILSSATVLFIWQTMTAYDSDQLRSAGSAMLLLSVGITIPVLCLALLALWREAPHLVAVIEKGDDVEHVIPTADPFRRFVAVVNSTLRLSAPDGGLFLASSETTSVWRSGPYLAGVREVHDSVQLWIGVDDEVTRVFLEPMTTAAARRVGSEIGTLFNSQLDEP